MVSITVRNLDDSVESRLRIRAAENRSSMEQEARGILKAKLDEEAASAGSLGTAAQEPFKFFGGVELEIPARGPMRELPRFD